MGLVTSEPYSEAKKEALWVWIILGAGLTYLGLKYPILWLPVFLATSTYSVADMLIDKFIKGDRGAPHILIFGNRIGKRIGRRSLVFLVYFGSILCVSVLADLYIKSGLLFVTFVSSLALNRQVAFYLVSSYLAVALVFFDMRFRFYNLAKRKRRAKQPTRKG